MTLSEIYWKHKEAMHKDLQELLRDNHLDGYVIRISDGKEGKLQISTSIVCDIKFYPITKSGKLSNKADSYVYPTIDINKQFKPKEEK